MSKPEKVKIYVCESFKLARELLHKLEDKGVTWASGDKPTYKSFCTRYGIDSFYVVDGKDLGWVRGNDFIKDNYPKTKIINYKGKL